MPAWLSVYCTLPIDDVSPDQLCSGIRDNDYWTLAEQYDVDEELVDPALELRASSPMTTASNCTIARKAIAN